MSATQTRPFRVEPAQFGARLRLIREEAGLSQQELADAMGVSAVTVSLWEAGRRSPNFIQVVKAAKFLKRPIADFAVVPDVIPERKSGRPKKSTGDESE